MVDVLVNLGLTAAGIAMLCVGADRLVLGSAALAARFGISGFVVGVTVVAYGTSTPELAAAIQAALRGESGIILGNVVGSNIANIGMVLGAAAVLGVVCVGRGTMRREVPVVVGISVLLLGVSVDGQIGWLDGVVLLGTLGVFTAYTLRSPREETEDGHTTIRLTVHADDKGKVIGRQGRVAQAMRVLLRVAAVKSDTRVSLEIE